MAKPIQYCKVEKKKILSQQLIFLIQTSNKHNKYFQNVKKKEKNEWKVQLTKMNTNKIDNVNCPISNA